MVVSLVKAKALTRVKRNVRVQKIKMIIKVRLVHTWLPDGIDHLKSFLAKINTMKRLMFGVLGV